MRARRKTGFLMAKERALGTIVQGIWGNGMKANLMEMAPIPIRMGKGTTENGRMVKNTAMGPRLMPTAANILATLEVMRNTAKGHW